MSNKFNDFIFKGLLINLGFIALAVLVLLSYMDKNNLTFDTMVDESTWGFNFNSSDHYNFVGWDFNSDNPSSMYETITLHEEHTFDAHEKILIESNIESITFIHEDRDDIRVVFDRELPDTSKYLIDYTAKESSEQITVRSELSYHNLFTDIDYEGSITLYVPIDYHCESLTIDSDFTKISNPVIPNSVENLNIQVDFGEIELDITNPIDNINIQLDFGELTLNIEDVVGSLSIDADSAATELNVTGAIDELSIYTNFGAVEAVFDSVPNDIMISADAADVNLDFNDTIKALETKVNFGDINIDVLSDEKAKVYKTSEFADFDSDLDITTRKSDASIIVIIDVGSVDINTTN